MEKADFDKRFLALVNQTNVVITAANIAYHLEIPIEEAQEHLLSLELNGVLQQQEDDQGNTFYAMPNRPAPGTLPAQLSSGDGGGQGPAGSAPPGVHNPAEQPPAPIYSGPQTAPIGGKAINQLVLNIVFPGFGSLVTGNMIGLAMMGLVLLGIVFFFVLGGWSKLLGILPIVIAWIWSFFHGLGHYMSNKAQQPGG